MMCSRSQQQKPQPAPYDRCSLSQLKPSRSVPGQTTTAASGNVVGQPPPVAPVQVGGDKLYSLLSGRRRQNDRGERSETFCTAVNTRERDHHRGEVQPSPSASITTASGRNLHAEEDKMETVEALLSLSDCSRSPEGSPDKTLITILPAHNPDKGSFFMDRKRERDRQTERQKVNKS